MSASRIGSNVPQPTWSVTVAVVFGYVEPVQIAAALEFADRVRAMTFQLAQK